MSVSITLRPLYAFIAWTETTVPFTLHAITKYDRTVTPYILKSRKMHGQTQAPTTYFSGNKHMGTD